jgi:tRNA1Val (adenine37-N6)-methyltransferase
MAFRFRQFMVEDEQSTMRVGTDSMLLGAWAQPQSALRILDIGTGCGVLALMMAQQSEGTIEAIDIDLPSVLEARNNFIQSAWNHRLTAIHDSLHGFSFNSKHCFDFIITNPPYFSNSLKSPNYRKNSARHDNILPLDELVKAVSTLLCDHGRFALILPAESTARCSVVCQTAGLHLNRKLIVYPVSASPARRVLMEYSRVEVKSPIISELTIHDSSGKFSEAYLTLTCNFHNF